MALALGVPSLTAACSTVPAEEEASEQQRAIVRDVCQLVIPRTQTASAAEIGVDEFVILALAHGVHGSREPAVAQVTPEQLRPDGSLKYLDWIETELNTRAGGNWLGKPDDERAAILAQLDTEAYPAGPPPAQPSPWRTIKGLILSGYYTSQVGATEELRYELVPGRFSPDIPLNPGDKAWSSDWTALEFG